MALLSWTTAPLAPHWKAAWRASDNGRSTSSGSPYDFMIVPRLCSCFFCKISTVFKLSLSAVYPGQFTPVSEATLESEQHVLCLGWMEPCSVRVAPRRMQVKTTGNNKGEWCLIHVYTLAVFSYQSWEPWLFTTGFPLAIYHWIKWVVYSPFYPELVNQLQKQGFTNRGLPTLHMLMAHCKLVVPSARLASGVCKDATRGWAAKLKLLSMLNKEWLTWLILRTILWSMVINHDCCCYIEKSILLKHNILQDNDCHIDDGIIFVISKCSCQQQNC